MNRSARRIALRVQYDGAPFAGSQRQAGRPTVQAALEAALAALTGAPHRVDLAGRTDAGVHALGQVGAFTTAQTLAPARWVGGLNHFLPPAVAVQAAREVSPAFDPRRQACDRTYVYRVRPAAVRQPLWAPRCWVVPGPLDEARMAEAIALLVGRHDFAAFGGVPARGGTIRTLHEARVWEAGGEIRLRFRANAFLPHQVRRTVGLLVRIGRGRVAPERITELLARPDAGHAGPTAPPDGLTLVRVRYAEPALTDWDRDDNDDLLGAAPGCGTPLARD